MSTEDQTTEVGSAVEAVVQQADAAGHQAYGRTIEGLKESAGLVSSGIETTHAKVKQNMDKAMKTAEEFISFNSGNLEAFMKSGQIWAAGMQDLSKQLAANAQASIEDTLSTYRALSGVKSLKDAMELQTSLARTALEKAVSETGRLTDASMRLAEQAIAPISARVSLAVEKLGKTA